MEFEWDERKRQRLLDERGIDLVRVARIFRGQLITEPDTRFDYGEDRYISIGKVEDEVFVLVHAQRADAIRLITAWRAGRRARRRYQARYP
ncbi:MAG: BrnT family toxin [Bauldia sp.]|nr:MAG: BrnT family toxin [Bauldia sp.]